MKKVKIQVRKTLLMLCLNSLSVIGLSQDTIYKSDGDFIIAKINEIRPGEISYHKFDFQDGPSYVEKKSNIKMISFSTGLKQTFEKPTEEYYEEKQKPEVDLNVKKQVTINSNKIGAAGNPYHFNFQGRVVSERQMYPVLLQAHDKAIVAEIKKAKLFHGLQFVGFGAIPLGIAGIACFDEYGNGSGDSALITAGAISLMSAITCPIVSGIFKHKRGLANMEAVRIYNQKY